MTAPMIHALVFDSGVGGLSVVRELRALIPDIYISYVADDAFRPYGTKTASQLKARLPELIQTLIMTLQPDIVVLACNTASTTALAEIREHIDIPIVGVVPAIKPAALLSKNKAIAVLGTPGTVRRKYVGKLIRDFASNCQVALHGSSRLVELAEQKLIGKDIDPLIMKAEVAPLFRDVNVDTIVLACTHFPLLLAELKEATPYDVNWIDSGEAIAKRTQSIAKTLDINPRSSYPQTAFLVGGINNHRRTQVFASFGFEKTVCLPA